MVTWCPNRMSGNYFLAKMHGHTSTQRPLAWPVRVKIHSCKSWACIVRHLKSVSSGNSRCHLDPSSQGPVPLCGRDRKRCSHVPQTQKAGSQQAICRSQTCCLIPGHAQLFPCPLLPGAEDGPVILPSFKINIMIMRSP